MQPTDVTAAAAWRLEFAPTTYETNENSELGQIQAELATIKEQLGIDAAATSTDFKCHGGERECDSLFSTLVKVDSSIEDMASATMALLGFVFSLLTFLLVLVMFIMTFAMKKKNNSVAMVTKG